MKYIYIIIGFLLSVGLILLIDFQENNTYTYTDIGETTFTTLSNCEMPEQKASSEIPYLILSIVMLLFSVVSITKDRTATEIIDIERKVFKNDKQYPRGCITTLT